MHLDLKGVDPWNILKEETVTIPVFSFKQFNSTILGFLFKKNLYQCIDLKYGKAFKTKKPFGATYSDQLLFTPNLTMNLNVYVNHGYILLGKTVFFPYFTLE